MSIFEPVLQKLGITELNKMQKETIEAAKQNDVVLLAPTGSGKTVAFLLPLLQHLKQDKKGVQALVLAPTRELAIQIEKVFRTMSTGHKVTCCYGGHPMRIERNSLAEPPALLIGTPGRIADHFRRQNIDANSIKFLVLDEFDKSLELGFTSEMIEILEQLPKIERRILTSATNALEIPDFAGLKAHTALNYTTPNRPLALEQFVVYANDRDKLDTLFRLMCHINNQQTILFCNHRDMVDRLSNHLHIKGINHGVFHGGLDQQERERSLIQFRNGSYSLLISTDLAARGLDIPEVKHVIHYQIAPTVEAFTHRNGRTARMFAGGSSWIILAQDDTLPKYIDTTPQTLELSDSSTLPDDSPWITVYVGGGRKDKINKIDIVGFFIQQGGITKDEIGIIEVLDHDTFVAISRSRAHSVVHKVQDTKLKGRYVKIAISL